MDKQKVLQRFAEFADKQKFVELSNNNVAVLERQFLEIRDRFQLGEVTRTDVSQAESAQLLQKQILQQKLVHLKLVVNCF